MPDEKLQLFDELSGDPINCQAAKIVDLRDEDEDRNPTRESCRYRYGMNLIIVPSRAKPMRRRITPAIIVHTARFSEPYFA